MPLSADRETFSADLIEKEVASSFPGIRGTLIHIWDTERFWLSVIKRQPALLMVK